MRMLTIVLAAAVLQVPGKAQAKDYNPDNPGGGGYVGTRHGSIGKDYYVVHKGNSNECYIVNGSFGDPPVGAIGGTPYASEAYAEAARKKFSECKGGEVGEATDTKKHKKN